MKLPRFLPWNHCVAKHRKLPYPTQVPGLDQQHQWYLEYNVDAINLGRMCEEFPGLKKSWEQFKIMYQLCKSKDETNKQNS